MNSNLRRAATLWLAALLSACSTPKPAAPPAIVQAPTPPPHQTVEQPAPPRNEKTIDVDLPHIYVDPAKRFIEIETTVIRRGTPQGEWLELLACTKGSKEHESILRTEARPRHVHLALLLLGLEPGSPMRWKIEDDSVSIETLPHGDRVAVTARYVQDDKQIEVPVNEWVFNQNTKKPLANNIWMFTGSRFVTFDGKEMYMADLDGLVLSLVNFGDELLARATRLTRLSDEEAWVTIEKNVPPVGTKVSLRLTPLPEDQQEAEQTYED